MPELHVVAGPNGIGKTTIFKNLVPDGLDYINADLIAKIIKEKAGGLNTQDIANREAAKIFYEEASRKESFAIETNLFVPPPPDYPNAVRPLHYSAYVNLP